MKRRTGLRLLLLLFLLLKTIFVQSQQIEVKGLVVNDRGDTLLGCVVYVKNGHTGVQTNINGEFSIRVRKGDTLSFSYVFHAPLLLPVLFSGYWKIILKDIEPTPPESGVNPGMLRRHINIPVKEIKAKDLKRKKKKNQAIAIFPSTFFLVEINQRPAKVRTPLIRISSFPIT